jgi:hypothetical protein
MQELLVPSRFDLMAKVLYVKYHEKKIKCDFFKEVYHQHIKTFNNCWEHPGTKVNIQDFLREFDHLIENMKANGFDDKHPIPIGKNAIIVNGAHRLVTSYILGIQPIFDVKNAFGTAAYNYLFFITRSNNPLAPIYADTMALEYPRHNKNLRCCILYPKAISKNKHHVADKIIREYGYVYYMKNIALNANGVSNLTVEAYRGEKWIGGMFPSGWSPGGKARLCVCDGTEQPQTIMYLVVMKDVNKLVEMKERVRQIYGFGKHSFHTTDYTEDTFRLSSALLNQNSVDFLNGSLITPSKSSQNLLTKYFQDIARSGYDTDDFCLVGNVHDVLSGSMERPETLRYITSLTDNSTVNDETEKKHNLLYDPKNYFFINGMKCMVNSNEHVLSTEEYNPIDGLKGKNGEIVGLPEPKFNNFLHLFAKLKTFCEAHIVDTDKLCVTSSSVLSVYGIRDCGDMDLFIDPQYAALFRESEFDNHNKYTIDEHYSHTYDKILCDRRNHFMYGGIKFCKLSIILKYKQYRFDNKLFGRASVEKDIRDIVAIHLARGC